MKMISGFKTGLWRSKVDTAEDYREKHQLIQKIQTKPVWTIKPHTIY